MSRRRFCEQCGCMLSDGVSFCDNCGTPVPQINVRQEAARSNSAARRPGNDGANRERMQRNNAAGRPLNEGLGRERMQKNNAADRPLSDGANRGGMMENNVSRGRRQTEPDWMRGGAGDAGTTHVPRRPDAYGNAEKAGTTEVPRRSDVRGGVGSTGAAPRRPAPYGTPNDVLRRQAGMGRPYPADLPQDEAYDVRRRTRYRQEELGGDWQESWEREYSEEVEEQRFTPVQYVLIGLMVLLLIALIAFGIYWIVGRNTDRSSRQPGAGVAQTDEEQTQQAAGGSQPDITILDDTANTPQEGAGQGGANQNGSGQTGANQNAAGQGDANQNGAGQNGTNQNAAGQAGSGQTGTNQNVAGQTNANQNAAGQNGTNQNVAGQINVNQNAAGQTDANQNAAGQTNANQNSTGQTGISQSETTPQTQAIEIQNNTTAAHTGDYLPQSSTRLLTDSDVAGMSYEDMQMAINEIYARHGRIFETPEIRDYFTAQPWYNGTVSQQNFNESVFSSVEAQNIQFLVEKMGD